MTILYVKPSDSTFVRIDEEILVKNFSTLVFRVDYRNSFSLLVSLLRLSAYLTWNIRKYQIVYTRFADYHSGVLALFCKLFRKKLMVVLGGYDVYYLPAFRYGVYAKPVRGWFARRALYGASYLLPNSPALVYEVNSYATDPPTEAGIKRFSPDTRANIQVVPNGFKTALWKPAEEGKRDRTILSVAIIHDHATFKIKGAEYFIGLARSMPDERFVYVGLSPVFAKELELELPANLKLVEAVPPDELLAYYQESKVFCIFSLTEGMPNALCEAMLCGCVPVGSNVSIIPEIIGDTGFIVLHKEVSEMKEAVLKAINFPEQNRRNARERILQHYSYEKRESELVSLIQSIG